jgi:TetR/AcrR family transcriptional regulator, transcriptional repressor for nem operon
MTKGERTRREIVEKAAPLFNQKGYEGTCLSDLMEATGLKKGGIYRHFSSRAALASEAFDCARRQAASGRLGRVDAVENHVHRLKKRIVAGGCPLMNTAVESDDGNAALRAGARKALRSWTERLAEITAKGSRKMRSTSAWIRRSSPA